MRSSPRLVSLVAVTLLGGLLPGAANAQSIIRSPTAVLQNTGGDFDPSFSIQNTINHSGLETDFTSGVTLFDPYIAGNPLHGALATLEWFTPLGVAASTIDYDLGATYLVDRLALWNEDGAGISTMDVFTSDSPAFASATFVGTFAPVPTTFDQSYGPEVFDLTDTNARYVRVVATGQNKGQGLYTSMGEIAFSTAAPGGQAVGPEPGSIALLLPVFGGLAVVARRRR